MESGAEAEKAPIVHQPAEQTAAPKKNKKWIPLVAVIAVVAVVAIIAMPVISALGSGQKGEEQMNYPTAATEQPIESPEEIPGGNRGAGAIPVLLGESIDNQFFTMTFNSLKLLDESGDSVIVRIVIGGETYEYVLR